MMDFAMIAILTGCIGVVALLVVWCQKQIDKSE